MSKRLLGLVLAVYALAAPALAQETTTGSLSGQVVDPQGLPLPGVTVTITSTAAPRSVVTDDQGRFFVAFLTPGIYAVRAELSGFAPVEKPRVEVRLGQGVRDYDDYTESAFGVANADFGRILAYQSPFTLRVGARWEF